MVLHRIASITQIGSNGVQKNLWIHPVCRPLSKSGFVPVISTNWLILPVAKAYDKAPESIWSIIASCEICLSRT